LDNIEELEGIELFDITLRVLNKGDVR